MADTSWPPIDQNVPPEARQAIIEHRLMELHRAVAKRELSTEQWEMVLWLIDRARSWKLLQRGGAWTLAVLAAIGTIVAQWDAVAKMFSKGP